MCEKVKPVQEAERDISDLRNCGHFFIYRMSWLDCYHYNLSGMNGSSFRDNLL